MTSLDDASPLTRVNEWRFATQMSPGWCIGRYANGGYLQSVTTRALGLAFPHPYALTSTGYFLLPVEAGPAEIEIEPVRTGRTLTRATARLLQAGEERFRVMATLGKLPPTMKPLYQAEPDLKLAPIGDCVSHVLGTPDGNSAPIRERYDTRYDPDSVGWATGSPTGVPSMSAWVRARDGSDPDMHALPVIADAMPCTGFELGFRSRINTVELTVQLRARPARGWLRCRWNSRLVGDGWMDEDCEMWDSTGRLVATTRQFAMLPNDPDAALRA